MRLFISLTGFHDDLANAFAGQMILPFQLRDGCAVDITLHDLLIAFRKQLAGAANLSPARALIRRLRDIDEVALNIFLEL